MSLYHMCVILLRADYFCTILTQLYTCTNETHTAGLGVHYISVFLLVVVS